MNGLTYLIELEPGQWLGRGVGIGAPPTVTRIKQARRFRSYAWAAGALDAYRQFAPYRKAKVREMSRREFAEAVRIETGKPNPPKSGKLTKTGRPAGARRPDTEYGVPMPSRSILQRIRQLSPDRAQFFREELSRRAYALAKISMGVLREEYDRLRDDVLAFVERDEFDPAEDFNYLHVIGPMESRNGSSLSPAIMRSKGAE